MKPDGGDDDRRTGGWLHDTERRPRLATEDQDPKCVAFLVVGRHMGLALDGL